MPSNKNPSFVITVVERCLLVRVLQHVHDQTYPHFVPDLINSSGTGFLQESFSFECPNSHIFNTITKETLAVRKLAVDLAGPDLS